MSHKQTEKGQSLVEFVIILPVLLIILAGLLDLGRLYYANVAVTDAAAEGAAYAAIHPEDTAEIALRAQEASGGLVEITEDMVAVASAGTTAGSPVTVTITYSFTTMTPLINTIVPDGIIPLQAVASEVILTGES